ncbi:class I SAM-dependent methyltransferase [Gracilibacillus thailandensis]|uniref:class I SAM-dependent methyltransferase n=1 Tax=Gracilibacillus thailandensis TaxID=563735 RepID=UPI0013D79400|nr:methyltransferase domain-containing protein [Gracilibacillus thailandensis]
MNYKVGVNDTYWNRRTNMMYYQYIDFLVRAFAINAKNILDVGTANTAYIENFDWISDKYTLDISKPYSSPNVTSIEMDFLEFNPENRFDFVTCLQVLEHIPKVDEFAKKLLEVSDRLLISVPYNWIEGSEDEHIHDPVDLDKVNKWFGREPSYYIIVEEPLRDIKKGKHRRLICYYQDEPVNYKKALQNVKEGYTKEIKMNSEYGNSNQNLLLNTIDLLRKEQEMNHEILETEFAIRDIETRLKELRNENKSKRQKIKALEDQIKKQSEKIVLFRNKQKYCKRQYTKIQNSRAWKVTDPIRRIKKLVK